MAKPRGTDGALLPSLPWTLAALTLALLPHLPFLPTWITAAFFACALWRFTIEKRRRALPPTLVRAVLALACFLGVLATYSSISGVGPGSALLAIMAALKVLETRRRRDQFVLLFISIFLVMASLLREQFLWSVPYLVVAVLLIMTAWLRLSAAPRESALRSFANGGRLLAYALPLALAMWMFFPRISTPFWAIPVDTSAATTGFSDTMSPGDISSLSQSDEVAFRVRFNGRIPAPRDRYWRGLVLHRFNGRSWHGSEMGHDRDALDTIDVQGEPVSYAITLEPTQQQWVFALDVPLSWSLPQTSMGRHYQLWREQPIDQRVTYEAVSYTEYQSGADMASLFKDWNRDLPADSNPRTAALARRMYAEAGSAGAYIDAVLQKFHHEAFYYTLQPAALGRHPVDQFLFETRQGFCEHYASAFAVMMRSAGIPARIVLGYQGGEFNPLGEYLIVRQADAHAWTEVWLEGSGWHRVDPTAAVAPDRIDVGMSGARLAGTAAAWGLSAPSALLHGLGLSWDAINARWNDWVLGYGPESQDKLMRTLGMDRPDWRGKMLSLVATLIMLVVAVSLLLALRYRAPRPDRAAALYQAFIAKTGLALLTGESPAAFAERARQQSPLDDAVIDAVTRAYLAARYGEPDPAALSELENRIRTLNR